ncbi:MalY/PatB family protein [Heyndrickxia acidicola]|uniref:cysteine-S-conjugate beta-lyase n=1 Tax=Heyndrickxia acidicola TaxID=209389 RepID=A0ABU6MFG5_9BACI|nr:MalY/PatB family protein [Heyndrickxia acidicola]MED1203411.1 pyridoxal phosphate-dependent aminotransferase [Heyndrickxia acidicola]
MNYDFNESINRLNTASIKWDEVENLFGAADILPMWVADMDFRCPQPVVDALKNRVEQGIYGYTTRPASYFDAVIHWMKKRHKWDIEKDWICHAPGVVPALGFIVQAYTNPGDKIIIQPPVYQPFTNVITQNGREVLENPLLFDNGTYKMDYDDLETKAKSGAKMIILSSPHNPVGRVWTKEELTRLGEICIQNNVLVVSDEIHFDLVYKGHIHTPFASIFKEFAMNSIICTAPSKTFNLAGIKASNIIIPNPDLRETYTAKLNQLFLNSSSTFGIAATEAAYRFGDEWLDQLLDYLQGSRDFLLDYTEKHLNGIKAVKPEGTYLVWLDCRELGMDAKALEAFMQKEAKVAFNEGYIFGSGGEGFTRVNIACPRSVLEEGLRRIAEALRKMRGSGT